MPKYQYQNSPIFPANAAIGQPHILEQFQSERRDERITICPDQPPLCDFVVTVLNNQNKSATAVRDFFDPKTKSFRLFAHLGKNKAQDMGSYFIWRQEERVAVSLLGRCDALSQVLTRLKVRILQPWK